LRVQPDDFQVMRQPLDFLGLNIYTRAIVAGLPLIGARPMRVRGPTTALGWEIYPACVYEVLKLAQEYTSIPLFITENGAAFEDHVHADGSIDDSERIAYLRAHLAEAHRAIQDGINLQGYLVWSLLDNFEWEQGYDPRFGLVHIDFDTLKRTPKRSAYWYRDVITRNAVG
jgi:beta-glucosidase